MYRELFARREAMRRAVESAKDSDEVNRLAKAQIEKDYVNEA